MLNDTRQHTINGKTYRTYAKRRFERWCVSWSVSGDGRRYHHRDERLNKYWFDSEDAAHEAALRAIHDLEE